MSARTAQRNDIQGAVFDFHDKSVGAIVIMSPTFRTIFTPTVTISYVNCFG